MAPQVSRVSMPEPPAQLTDLADRIGHDLMRRLRLTTDVEGLLKDGKVIQNLIRDGIVWCSHSASFARPLTTAADFSAGPPRRYEIAFRAMAPKPLAAAANPRATESADIERTLLRGGGGRR
jgi:hypothetical protein